MSGRPMLGSQKMTSDNKVSNKILVILRRSFEDNLKIKLWNTAFNEIHFFCYSFGKVKTDEDDDKNVGIFLDTVLAPQYFYSWKC